MNSETSAGVLTLNRPKSAHQQLPEALSDDIQETIGRKVVAIGMRTGWHYIRQPNPCGLSDDQKRRIRKWQSDWENGGREAHIRALSNSVEIESTRPNG